MADCNFQRLTVPSTGRSSGDLICYFLNRLPKNCKKHFPQIIDYKGERFIIEKKMTNTKKSRAISKRLEVNQRIINVRGQRVILDADLAQLYGTRTHRLNEQVKRNWGRFPEDFIFQLTKEEKSKVIANCDRLKKLKYSNSLPYAFTEHGAVMAANVLNSQIAIETSIMVVRAFISAREILAEHLQLKRRLDRLEQRVARGFQDNEEALQAIRFAIQQLMEPPEPKSKRPLGFGREK